MALPVMGAIAGAWATGAYLDARFLFRHDLSSGNISGNIKASRDYVEKRFKEDRMLVYHDLERHAQSSTGTQNLLLIFQDRSWTYKQFYNDLHRVGNWLIDELDIQKEEIVALDGGNSPQYLLIWLALESIGACPAFINSHITSQGLIHSVKLCDAKIMLADQDVTYLVHPHEKELQQNGCRVVYYSQEIVDSLKNTLPTPETRRSGFRPDHIGSLIYTSGTTGMPKGTIMLRGRELNTSRSIAQYLKLKTGDCLYTALPLYHGAAHGLCVTPSIFAGSTVVLSKKFSHKTFWPEVRQSKANIIQYVGELCRYLVNAPPSPLDKQHQVRMAWGNGMRPDVWDAFRERFGIETINELYAATDGLGASFNRNRGDFGKYAIGQRGLLWQLFNGAHEKRVRIDVVTQEIIRDANGYAIVCKTGEPGEVLHRMDPATADVAFAGYYRNETASQKRKIRDVFDKGDLWFRSGDMMRQDLDGSLYFVDRLGDTFRWKSENVSTNEVGDVIGSFNQIAEATVYGVQVPHSDGRCGCAAIVMVPGVTENQFDFELLAQHAISSLPRYAVPIFIRIVKQLQYTGTMKVQKGKVREEGIDLNQIQESRLNNQDTTDSIYWLPPGQSVYVPFTKKAWEELKAGKAKL